MESLDQRLERLKGIEVFISSTACSFRPLEVAIAFRMDNSLSGEGVNHFGRCRHQCQYTISESENTINSHRSPD